jgi:hypothetical protein
MEMDEKSPIQLTPRQQARQEGQKLLYDSLKHLTTLSTGSVILLATLLEKFFKTPRYSDLVSFAFGLLVLSSMSAFATMLALSDSIFHFKEATETGSRTGKLWFRLSLLSFGTGISLFVLFALLNFHEVHHPGSKEVTFTSPCECERCRGKNRWILKIDPSPVPMDKSTIQSVTPSQIYGWQGPRPDVTRETKTRIPSEEKWYALTGRVVGLKVEADGDIHIALKDATGNGDGIVSAEIPAGEKWCEIRKTIFNWTMQSFPFAFKRAKKLKAREQHVITVTGKAFYDVGHAPKDHSNRRTTPSGYAVWEIHPVMQMEVIQ